MYTLGLMCNAMACQLQNGIVKIGSCPTQAFSWQHVCLAAMLMNGSQETQQAASISDLKSY